MCKRVLLTTVGEARKTSKSHSSSVPIIYEWVSKRRLELHLLSKAHTYRKQLSWSRICANRNASNLSAVTVSLARTLYAAQSSVQRITSTSSYFSMFFNKLIRDLLLARTLSSRWICLTSTAFYVWVECEWWCHVRPNKCVSHTWKLSRLSWIVFLYMRRHRSMISLRIFSGSDWSHSHVSFIR